MNRFISLCAAAVLLSACDQASTPATPAAPPASAVATPPASMILTAQGWGPLRIGMTLAEVTTALGPDSEPEAPGGFEPEFCDQFRPERAPSGMLVMIEQGRLTRISLIGDSTIKTDRGFGVGDEAAAIKAAYGGGVVSKPHKYVEPPAEDLFVWASGGSTDYVEDPDARGIRYEIGADGKVRMIHAGGPAIQLVEGCN